MRPVCDVCEAAPAQVFCAADEAALCSSCDEKVHGCNKLASRHVRLTLAEASAVRRCDICETTPAFFFCGVDGTSLCLQCDMTVHVGGKKTHERYLLMGQRVELPRGQVEAGGKQPMMCSKMPEAFGVNKQQSKPYSSKDDGSCNTSAIAVAIGETGSPVIDLNSRPQQEHSGASQGARDRDLNENKEEAHATIQDSSSKGKQPFASQ